MENVSIFRNEKLKRLLATITATSTNINEVEHDKIFISNYFTNGRVTRYINNLKKIEIFSKWYVHQWLCEYKHKVIQQEEEFETATTKATKK